jgi:lysophospholipase L1-like esterase
MKFPLSRLLALLALLTMGGCGSSGGASRVDGGPGADAALADDGGLIDPADAAPPVETADKAYRAFGDESTNLAGFQNIDPEARYPSLLVGTMGFASLDVFAPGSTGIHGASGLEGQRSHATDQPHGFASFFYGNVDADSGVIDEAWRDDYRTYLQSFLDAGYPADHLVLVSPSYLPTADGAVQARLAQAREYTSAIANELGLRFVDLYADMKRMNDAAGDPALEYSVYAMPPTAFNEGLWLTQRGHALLADLVRVALVPPTYMGGQARAKLFGAGSAMAGISSYRHSFVQLFGELTHRHPENYAVAGTGVAGGTNDLAALKLEHADDGERDVVLFLYGNNDGNGTPDWKASYKAQLQYFLDEGYAPGHVVVMTITMSPNLATNNPNDWARMRAANVSIRELAAELGIVLVDLETRYALTSWYADDYHLNDAANVDLAGLLASMR